MEEKMVSLVFKFKVEDINHVEKMTNWLRGSLGLLIDIEMDKLIIDAVLDQSTVIKNSVLNDIDSELISETIE